MSAPKVKCTKVKNPCKFCLNTVTKRTGLRCKGACKKWAHYKCLNYTPGKIEDIKAGIIRVTCPCPDCETTSVKEYLANPPYKCTNNQCPANKTPKCPSVTTIRPKEDKCKEAKRRKTCPPPPPPPPLCAPKECPNTSQKSSQTRLCPLSFPSPSQCSVRRGPSPKTKSVYTDGRKSRSPSYDCPLEECPSHQKKKKDCKKKEPKPCPPKKDKDKKCKKNKKKIKSPCPSFTSLDDNSSDTCPNQCLPKDDAEYGKGSPRCQASLMEALQEMCSTVGKLSVQLKELMCKMI